jgi:hypothetical protein
VLSFRLGKQLHRFAAIAADREGASLDQPPISGGKKTDPRSGASETRISNARAGGANHDS